MRVVVQLLGRWPMYGLAGESKRGSFTHTQKMLSQAGNGDLSKMGSICGQPFSLTKQMNYM